MNPSTSPLNYLRVVQQLQKKTEELERVASEAQGLQREKAVLLEEKAALLREVARLEAQSRDWRDEFSVLEKRVRQHQRHLQEHIKREAQKKEREEKEEDVAAQCRRLKRELRAAQTCTAAETAVVDQSACEALNELKGEVALVAAENDRLMSELEAERQARVVAESGVVNLQQILHRQREVSERQQQLARQELQAVNVQNRALLEDVKRLTEHDVVTVNNAAPHRRVSTVDRGTMMTNVAYTALWPPSVHSAAQVTPATQNSDVVFDDLRGRGMDTHVHKLEKKVRSLESTADEQALLLREEVNKRLLEERAQLHEEECRRLRTLLNDVTTRERTITHHSSNHDASTTAGTELSAILEAVVEILRLFVHCATRLRTRFSLSASPTDPAVLPVIPCHEHRSPYINAIFSHLGGLRHIVAVIEEIGETVLSRQQKQQKKQEIQETTTAETIHSQTHPAISSPGCAATSKTHTSDSPNATFRTQQTEVTKRDINSWLTVRQKSLKRQIPHAKPQQYNPPSIP